MKNWLTPLVLAVALVPASAQNENSALEEWLEKWDNSRDYSLRALEMLSDEDLAFEPTDDQMSARAQFRHLAGNMYGLSKRYLDAPAFDNPLLKKEDADKEELTQLLTAAHAYAATAVRAVYAAGKETETVDFFAGPKTRRQVVYLLQDHATHHRAQLLVYLRLLGHQPPRYVGW